MSYSDDLDWLARNVHQWDKFGATRISKAGEQVVWSLPSNPPDADTFTKAEWLSRRAELQNKPSWSDAPEWVKFLIQTMAGWWLWLSDEPHHMNDLGIMTFCIDVKSEKAEKGELLGDWRSTLERRPEPQSPVDMAMSIIGADSLEPEPKLASVRNETVALEQPVVAAATGAGAEPDANTSAALIADTLIRLRDCPDHFSADELADLNKLTDAELTKRDERVCGGQRYIDAHWFERGELPPVGVVCEAATEGCKYERCEILAYHKGQVALRWFEFNDGCLDVLDFDGWSFRPIRTERDEAIEAMKAHCPYPGSWETTYRLFAEALYDAGYRAGGSE